MEWVTTGFFGRAIQTDNLITHLGSRSQNNFRLSIGIVIRF
jgi:hypothetical protein